MGHETEIKYVFDGLNARRIKGDNVSCNMPPMNSLAVHNTQILPTGVYIEVLPATCLLSLNNMIKYVVVLK